MMRILIIFVGLIGGALGVSAQRYLPGPYIDQSYPPPNRFYIPRRPPPFTDPYRGLPGYPPPWRFQHPGFGPPEIHGFPAFRRGPFFRCSDEPWRCPGPP